VIDGGVPIGIVEDDCVGSCQIDTKTTGTGGQQEYEDFRVRLEVCDSVATVFKLGASVQTAVFVVSVCQVLFHKVDHTCHLEV
jgi:hypothetical protein